MGRVVRDSAYVERVVSAAKQAMQPDGSVHLGKMARILGCALATARRYWHHGMGEELGREAVPPIVDIIEGRAVWPTTRTAAPTPAPAADPPLPPSPQTDDDRAATQARTALNNLLGGTILSGRLLGGLDELTKVVHQSLIDLARSGRASPTETIKWLRELVKVNDLLIKQSGQIDEQRRAKKEEGGPTGTEPTSKKRDFSELPFPEQMQEASQLIADLDKIKREYTANPPPAAPMGEVSIDDEILYQRMRLMQLEVRRDQERRKQVASVSTTDMEESGGDA